MTLSLDGALQLLDVRLLDLCCAARGLQDRLPEDGPAMSRLQAFLEKLNQAEEELEALGALI